MWHDGRWLDGGWRVESGRLHAWTDRRARRMPGCGPGRARTGAGPSYNAAEWVSYTDDCPMECRAERLVWRLMIKRWAPRVMSDWKLDGAISTMYRTCIALYIRSDSKALRPIVSCIACDCLSISEVVLFLVVGANGPCLSWKSPLIGALFYCRFVVACRSLSFLAHSERIWLCCRKRANVIIKRVCQTH